MTAENQQSKYPSWETWYESLNDSVKSEIFARLTPDHLAILGVWYEARSKKKIDEIGEKEFNSIKKEIMDKEDLFSAPGVSKAFRYITDNTV